MCRCIQVSCGARPPSHAAHATMMVANHVPLSQPCASMHCSQTRMQAVMPLSGPAPTPHTFVAPLPRLSCTPPHTRAPRAPHAQASQAVRKVMAELKLLGGPLGHLEIGPKIGEGGFGVVHAGEGGHYREGAGTELGHRGGEGLMTNLEWNASAWCHVLTVLLTHYAWLTL